MAALTDHRAASAPVVDAARTAVVVPAYQPDARLVRLVDALRSAVPGLPVVVVDDGSDRGCGGVFRAARALGAVVLTVPVNRGKGHALRTGVRWVRDRLPGHGVVCADADGQHTVTDVLRVAARAEAEPDVVVLGSRRLAGRVPLRSRVGNAATRQAFALATGTRVHDTQTGLRAYGPGQLDELLAVGGDRYEYELRALLEASRSGRRVVEVEIATIYLEGNASSHFRPVADSLRVWAPLLRFAASSLASAAVDVVALLALQLVTGSLLAAVVGARLLSAGVNFAANRRLVFGRARQAPLRTAAVRYAALAVLLLAASYGLLALLTGLGAPLLAAKLGTDLVLFVASYEVQRRVVFSGARAPRERRHRGGRDRVPCATMRGMTDNGDIVFAESQIGKGMKPLAQHGAVVIGADGTFTLLGTKGDVIDSAPIAEVTAKRSWYTGGQTVMLDVQGRKYNTTPGWGASLGQWGGVVGTSNAAKALTKLIGADGRVEGR